MVWNLDAFSDANEQNYMRASPFLIPLRFSVQKGHE